MDTLKYNITTTKTEREATDYMSEKSKGEMLKEKLFFKPKQGFETLGENKVKEAYDFCEGYKKYLDNGKTEREAADETVRILEESGFKYYKFGEKYNPGDGVYINHDGKYILAANTNANKICAVDIETDEVCGFATVKGASFLGFWD